MRMFMSSTNVFISYPHKNAQRAINAYCSLNAYNISCFLDVVSISSNDQLTQSIRTGIDNCSHLVIVISKHVLDSNWVNYEIGLAQGANKEVLAYYSSDLNRSKLPDYIKELKTIASLRTLLSYFGCKKPEKFVRRSCALDQDGRCHCDQSTD